MPLSGQIDNNHKKKQDNLEDFVFLSFFLFFSKYEIGNRNSLSIPLFWLFIGSEFAKKR